MKRLGSLALIMLFATPATAQQQEPAGSIEGQVKDPSGAAVPGARVEISRAGGRSRVATSDGHGAFALARVRPGAYTVVVTKEGFETWARPEIAVATGQPTKLDVELLVARIEETVTVRENGTPLSLSPDNNGGAIVLKGADLDALPDDPDELADALQALAGPSAGPNGGQIFIDGFTGGRMPPKASIREIRLNSNPYSAQYDRLGFGRIEIFTKPGADHFRSQASFSFNNQALNAKDPFASTEPPYHRMEWGGNLSGPLPSKKASYFVDFERRNVRDTAIINGEVLDPSLQIVPYSDVLTTPQWRTTVSPRLDFQLGAKNTLTLRYTYTSVEQDNAGIGGFSLPGLGYDRTNHQHTLQLTETMVKGKLVNETRFRWLSERAGQTPASTLPTLQVQDAFTSGGSPIGVSSNDQDRVELSNETSWSRGNHSFHAGARLRWASQDDVSRQNFGGTVSFAGGFGPQLDAAGRVVYGPDGSPLIVPLTSIERYQRSVALEKLGLSGTAIRALGGGATQLQIAGGVPLASVDQWDVAPYFQDDWKVSPRLLVGFGLRYEVQNNIKAGLDLAPRASFAWSLGKTSGSSPATIVRGGVGIFYDRISEGLTLDVRHLDAAGRASFLVTDPTVLDALSFGTDGSVTNVPPAALLAAFAQPQVTRALATDLAAPRTLQSSLSIERALPKNFTVTGTWIFSRTDRALRSRVLWTPASSTPAPSGATGPVYEYESTGHLHQDQWVVAVNNRLTPRLSVFFNYFLNWARGDTDGAGSFPADSSDPAAEWGRSSIDARHRFVLGGRVVGPWGVSASPFILWGTGRPFNITAGRDINRDTVFSDRPAFASPGDPNAVATPWGLLDPTPLPGEALIPRNLGEGPGFFVFNVRLSKTIPLGRRATTNTPQPGDGGPRRGPGGGGFGGGRGGPGGGGGGRPGGGGGARAGGGEGGRGITFSLSAQNLFNHTNPASPVGNLSSPLFGESLASAGAFGRGGAAGMRRIELQARFSF